uniref:Secreted protein n=1 Tax=Syphacia muris TaxID=451379 RepID=A0A0N5ABB4_9BILA
MHGLIFVTIKRLCPFGSTLLLLLAIYHLCVSKVMEWQIPTIIVITPTHPRPERLADMTRLVRS